MNSSLNNLHASSSELVHLRRQILDLEQALQKGEPLPTSALQQRALRAAQIGTWDWDRASNRVFWSAETEQICGVAPGSFGGTFAAFIACVHKDDRTKLGAAIQLALSSLLPYHSEHRMVAQDGTIRWVSCRGRALKNDTGDVVGMAGTIEDVTLRMETEQALREARDTLDRRIQERTLLLEEAIGNLKAEIEHRRAVESALRASEQRYLSLYENNPSMYFTLSIEGLVLSVNRFGAEQLGYRQTDLVGQSVLTVFAPFDHQTVLTQLKQCADYPQQVFEWEIQKICKDRTRIWVRERARAILDAAGTLTILVVCENVTEQYRATQLLKTLVRECPLPILSLDQNAIVQSWNQAATRLFGWTEEEVIGRELPYVPAGQESSADTLWDIGTRNELQGPIELRRCRKDGVLLDLLLWPVFVHGGLGELSTAVGIYVDQSELKRAEAAQIKSEVRLRAFLNSLDDLAFEFDREGTCLNLWTRNETPLLLPKQDIVGKRLTDIYDTEEAIRYLASITRVLSTGQSESIEYAVLIGEQRRYFSAMLSQIPAVGSANPTVACVVRDISAQKQTETALRDSEIRLHRFVDEAPVGLIILDTHRCILKANTAFCKLTGYAEQEMLGKSYALYVHPDDFTANLILTDQFYRGDRTEYTCEKRYIRRSGEIIWVSVKATRIELPGHSKPLLLAAIQDITEQKLATEEREQLSRDLHDNILQSLYAVGMQLEASRMALGVSPRKSKSHMAQATKQLNHLMLDVRKFITVLTQRAPAQLNFGLALRQLIASLSATDQAAPTLNLDDSALPLITSTQGEHLLNITREALSNSIRHAQATDRSVRLSHTGAGIRLVIEDNGIGFVSKRRPRQGHGLANMAARAQQILARFTLDSAPGKGTCITVEIPTAQGSIHA
jgi:PAS domain S-box-containing protein